MENNKLFNLFHNINESELNILTRKFTLKAFQALFPYIIKCKQLNIFISDNLLFINKNVNREKRNYMIDYNQINMLNVDAELKLKNDLMNKYYAIQFGKMINEKIFIKSSKNDNSQIHFSFSLIDKPEKIYLNNTDEISAASLGIVKSNDKFRFTTSKEVDDYNDALEEFQAIWNDSFSFDVSNKYIDKLNSIYRDFSPADIYYFNLYHIFNKNLEEYQGDKASNVTEWKNTIIYKSLYDFQTIAVHGIIEKIEKYNGCILADSVGLGKTYEALAVIKYYEMLGMRVLVLTPKKLKSNWDLYRNNSSINPLLDDSFKYDVLCHTDINREKGMSGSIDLSTHRWDNYDLVVIDESHNFRNRNWKTDENATKTRYQHLMEKIIKSGRKTKVLLLSAAPVNNSMHDIDNQIKFITNDKDNAFEEYGLKSISKICANAEKKSYEWSKYDVSTRTLENFEKLIGPEFKKLMDLISIARSRKQIVNNYKSNLIFPKRLDPINIKVNQLISKGLESSIKSIYDKIKIMTFGLYTPIKYIKPNVRDLYIEKYKKQNKDNFDQSDREKSLTKIMMTNWLKRYESSINSFMITLNKFYEKNKNLLSWLNNLGDNSFGYNSDDDFIDFDDEEDFDMIFSTKIPIRKQDIDVIKCKSDIMHDLDLIEEIRGLYKNINETNDDKLNELRKIIYSKISNPINKNNKKIIIFSSYADTATYIYDSIQKELKDKGIYCALATGSYNKTNNDDVRTLDMNELLTYFSPKSKQLSNTKLKQNVNIDILIATDCISEGQNLQDCDYLINYDIHWNPVRIIQRYGRIDRIGSTNKKIQMVNFWPNIELEEYINLENIVHTKMSKVQHAGTADENILDNTFAETSYRLKQLEELQNKVVDLEDLKGDVCISNLTFSEFTTDLQLYLENNSNKLINQPTGIFSIAKAEKIKPGVIFLFKNLSVSKTDNIIEPYYLIYVDMNGELILSYNDTTKILGLLKSISNSQNEVNKDLITKFNEKTEFGFKMDKYSIILDKAIEKINNKKDISKISSLFNKESEKNETQPEYELISFLIIGDNNV